MSKKRTIECDSCQTRCVITYKGSPTVECCPFCGEEVHIIETSRQSPRTLDDYDASEDYYDDNDNDE